MKGYYVIDIESNGLLNDMLSFKTQPYKLREDARLWTVVVKNLENGEVFSKEKENITKQWLQDTLKDCTNLIAHNGLKFDFPVLKLFGLLDYCIGYLDEESTLFGKPCKFLDTLLISRMTNPDRFGGHSLESWGERVEDFKTDYRQQCIEQGYIEKGSRKGEEFKVWNPLMKPYCIQDCNVTEKVFYKLLSELEGYSEFKNALKQETKLADLSWKREILGFKFDKELALNNLKELQSRMETIANSINPILPPKPMNIGELKNYTPPKNQISDKFIKETTPPKNQLKADGSLSNAMVNFIERVGAEKVDNNTIIFKSEKYKLPLEKPLINYTEPSEGILKFAEKVGAEIESVNGQHYFNFEGQTYTIPLEDKPLKQHIKADIDDLDHVKMYLISLGWSPLEWRERDLTKDSKKQSIPYEKREKALRRWVDETLNGKYKEQRLTEVGISVDRLYDSLERRLHEDKPVKVPTSPCVRVGVSKELCPNLIALGDKVAFAKDFALYLTYKHRKNSIAGGEIEDMDFDLESPNTGYLSMIREEDGRVPTPSIEVGAATNRFKHIGVVNVPRVSSEFGKQMRGMFKTEKGKVFFGMDYASLEARIMGHYVYDYEGGQEEASMYTAEKPNDWHTQVSLKVGMDRGNTKNLNYGLIYGAQPNKISKMVNCDLDRANELYNDLWNAVPGLKKRKQELENEWESTGKKYIKSIDGRRINIRSKHSLLNFLFQSSGSIFAKYVFIFIMEAVEKMGYNTDPTKGGIDIGSMISMHDEEAFEITPKILNFKTFKTEEEAKDFVKNWNSEQLSGVLKGKKDYYVCLPNDLSKIVTKAVKRAEEHLNIKVPMGFEWLVGNNWAECH